MTIKFSQEFLTAYKRLKKKHKSLQNDFEALMLSLQNYPQQGVELMDAVGID